MLIILNVYVFEILHLHIALNKSACQINTM